MTHSTETTDSKGKKLEVLMEKGFVVLAFAIFLFAMISTLTKPGHETAGADSHGHSEAPAASHH